MLTIIIRTLLIYAIVTVAVRIMGKRQVSDMQPTELVTTLIISEIAALPLENPERPLLSAPVSIMMLVADRDHHLAHHAQEPRRRGASSAAIRSW